MTPQLDSKLNRHFLACSAFVGTAVVLTAQRADASIIYSGIQNISVPTTNNSGGFYLDLETRGTFIPSNSGTGGAEGLNTLLPGWDLNPYQSGSGRFRNYLPLSSSVVTNAANGAFQAPLIAGTPINSGLQFARIFGMVNTANTGPWVSTNAYIGVRFDTSSQTGVLGWIHINAGPTAGIPATIIDWAYETTPGAGIVAGAVPEPSSLALGFLGAGAAGIAAWRKRKKV